MDSTDFDQFLLTHLEVNLLLTPIDDPIGVNLRLHAGRLLYDRYRQTGVIGDLNEAVRIQEQVVEATAEDSQDLARRQSALTVLLLQRFLGQQNEEDFKKAMELAASAVENAAGDSVLLAEPQKHLSGMHIIRYELEGTLHDLDAAIRILKESNLDHAPKLLSDLLKLRFERLRRIEDLDDAISNAEKVSSSLSEQDGSNHTRLKDLKDMRQRWLTQNAQLQGLGESIQELDIAASSSCDEPLCDTCKNITFRRIDVLPEGQFEQALPYGCSPDFLYYQHKPSLDALKQSAGEACQFCAHIVFAFEQYDFSKDTPPTTLNGFWFSLDPSQSRLKSTPQAIGISYKNKMAYAYFRMPDETGRTLWFRKIDRENDTNTGSSANIDLARSWYIGCTATHLKCAVFTSTELPSRVIDIDSLEETMVRLVIGGPNEEPYAALSHCWGNWGAEHGPKLTESNMSSLQKGFQLSEIPLTWQHAVATARQLGLSYLWIDSLCIIQDSTEDWEIESAKMGNYYRKASITIAALSGRDGRKGLYNSRDPATVKPCELRISIPREGKIYRVHALMSSFEPGISGFYRFSPAPLERRAWCFQEMILSPRVLKFGPHQISWACYGYQASEHEPGPLSRADRYHVIQGLLMTTVFDHDIFKTCDHPPDERCDAHASATNVWNKLVENYSRLELTYDSDRLPALSGIARLVHERIGGEYLAGIWSSGLLLGLLWRTIDYLPRGCSFPLTIERDSRYRPNPPLAPSWSWASIILDKAEVSFLSQSVHDVSASVNTIAESMTATVQCTGSNPYGQVHTGTLIIKSKMCSASSLQFDIGSKEYFFGLNLVDDASGKVVGRADFDETIWPTTRFWCIPLAYFVEPDIIAGLLLSPCNVSHDPTSISISNCYKRIGRFNIKGAGFFDNAASATITVM